MLFERPLLEKDVHRLGVDSRGVLLLSCEQRLHTQVFAVMPQAIERAEQRRAAPAEQVVELWATARVQHDNLAVEDRVATKRCQRRGERLEALVGVPVGRSGGTGRVRCAPAPGTILLQLEQEMRIIEGGGQENEFSRLECEPQTTSSVAVGLSFTAFGSASGEALNCAVCFSVPFSSTIGLFRGPSS